MCTHEIYGGARTPGRRRTVQCVEIPGAISQGETREEALATIKEAIELVLEARREELHRKSPAHRREISRVEVADVA